MRPFIAASLAFALLITPLSASALTAEEVLVQLSELRDAIGDAQSQLAAAADFSKKLKSRPRVARDPIPAALNSLGSVTLIRFKVTAHEKGDVGLGRVMHSVNANGLIVGNDRIYGYTDPSYTNPIPGYLDGLIPRVGPSFAAPLQIPAGGTYYFKIVADVSASTTKGSIVTHVLGDSAPSGLLTFDEQVRAHARFVWSPNSTTTSTYAMRDWLNGADAGMRNNISQRLQYVGPKPISVRSPNGGETWTAAPRATNTISGFEKYRRDIKWGGVPDFSGFDGKVLAYLEDTAGNTVGRIPAFAYGSIAWVVGVVNPNSNCGTNVQCLNGTLTLVEPGSYYVRLVDTASDTSDKSDAPFTIVAEHRYQCTGSVPKNASLCSGDSAALTQNYQSALVSTCSSPAGSAPKCEYTCTEGYEKKGNECVHVDDFVCTGPIPPSAYACPGDDKGLAADTPRSLRAACSLPRGSAPKCEYVCGPGFSYSGGGCVVAWSKRSDAVQSEQAAAALEGFAQTLQSIRAILESVENRPR